MMGLTLSHTEHIWSCHAYIIEAHFYICIAFILQRIGILGNDKICLVGTFRELIIADVTALQHMQYGQTMN